MLTMQNIVLKKTLLPEHYSELHMKEHNDILWRDFFKRVHLSPRSPVLRSGQFSHRFHHVIPLSGTGHYLLGEVVKGF